MTFGLVKHNNNSISAITTPGNLAQGKMTLLQTQTASSSASISFTSNIDSTYPIYVFKFINIHPATNNTHLMVNFRDGGSSYDATKTTTVLYAYHDESDSEASVIYSTGSDLAQSTSGQRLTGGGGNGTDESASGTLHLFDPSNTTFVKHFICRSQVYVAPSSGTDFSQDMNTAGYINTTTALTRVRFKFHSGNIDNGTIKMYGVL